MDKLHRVTAMLSAVVLCGITACFAVGSVMLSEPQRAAESTLWKPLLHVRDRAVLLLGGGSIGDVYVTESRMLAHQADYSTAQLSASADRIRHFAAQTDTPVYLLAVPSAAALYADELPAEAPVRNEQELLREAKQQLQTDVNWIETLSRLSAERDQYLYYRTDSRWTTYGAYCVYKTAIRRLGFAALGYDRFDITHFNHSYYGDLAQAAVYRETEPDLVDLYSCKTALPLLSVTAVRQDGTESLPSYYREELAAETGNAYDVFGAVTEPILQIEADNQSSKNLLLLTDSFGGCMVPFLLQHYHELTVVNLELVKDTGWQAQDYGTGTYSQILILCSTETLVSEDGLAALQADA